MTIKNTATFSDNNRWHTLSTNISFVLKPLAETMPHKSAVVEAVNTIGGTTKWKVLTFQELNRESDRLALGLKQAGLGRGMKTALMVRPGVDFVLLTYALFKIGAVITLIDPGMGLKNLGKCLDQVKPEAFVGITAAQAARILLRWCPDTIKHLVTVGPRLFWGGTTLKKLKKTPWESFPVQKMSPDETAAILFTSGSTGVAKGAEYTHKIFSHQVKFLQETWPFNSDDVDLATFPLFALFDPALGITAVIPAMDSSRPASANPEKLVQAIEEHNCNQMFGSPALIDNLGRYLESKNIRLNNMKRVLSCGAPVRPDVLRRLYRALHEEAEIFTPYGATEALPVSNISSREILDETWELTERGEGTCVGKPVAGIDLAVIKITDDAIEEWSDSLLTCGEEPGEITVTGPIVTTRYHNRPEQTRMSKIRLPGNHGILHRMGDIGMVDQHGRIWFYGRKDHRVITAGGTLYTVPVESVFNTHEHVYRTALVGTGVKGRQEPVICVELEKNIPGISFEKVASELRQMAIKFAHTRTIKTFLLHPGFPVDVRHNAKINREQLREWAIKKLYGNTAASGAADQSPGKNASKTGEDV